MAAGGGRGDPLAVEPLPEPQSETAPAEGRWGDQEPAAQAMAAPRISRRSFPKLCSVCLQIQFKILRGHSDTVSSCHFCCEDSKILSCSYDRTVKLWEQIRVVTSSYDNTVKTWDMETGKVLWTIEHEGIVTSCNISCDGKYVVSGSDKGCAISVFDAVSAREVACVQGHHMSTITRCCFDPDNQRVTSVSYDKTIKLWDMVARSTSITIKEGHSNAISDCCFTSDGRFLCTASWDKNLKIWDIKTGEFQSRGPVTLKEGHEGSVSSCCFSQDASLVVSGGYDNTIAIWETGAGYKKLSLKGHWDWVTDVAISENQKWILSASKVITTSLMWFKELNYKWM
ncbi:hypothetical protein ASZ78_010367 [Callipepla squamata]|uniref:Uncharacterized protein n=1 Tax=Callipepla squamata TaxID=9009 RepID=A0A226NJ87_CALSU|nr:hypothetical protein ASZ78_010367 [Callipepla squamata]